MYAVNAIAPRAQQGAVLVVGLVILGVLLLLSAGAVMVANTQFKASGNQQYRNLALANAESAIATAENWLNTNASSAAFVSGGTAGLYPANALVDAASMQWDDSTSIKVDPAGTQRYAIELYMPARRPPTSSVAQCNTYGAIAPCTLVNLYRISARGTSALGSTSVVQTIYAVRTN